MLFALLSTFLHPAAWNTGVMARALASVLGQEAVGHNLGVRWKNPSHLSALEGSVLVYVRERGREREISIFFKPLLFWVFNHMWPNVILT